MTCQRQPTHNIGAQSEARKAPEVAHAKARQDSTSSQYILQPRDNRLLHNGQGSQINADKSVREGGGGGGKDTGGGERRHRRQTGHNITWGEEGGLKRKTAGGCEGREGNSDRIGERRSGRQRRRRTTTTRATTAVGRACGGVGTPIGDSTPAGGGLMLIRSSQIQSTESREKRKPTARSISPPSAVKFKVTNGSHGFTFRHTSLARGKLRFESEDSEVGRRNIGT